MLLFNVWFIFSVFPVDCGLQDECSFRLIWSTLDTCWVILETNTGPSPLWWELGSPNWGIISLRTTLTPSEAFPDLVGYASNYPVKVSTNASRYVKFPVAQGIWVKSIGQSLVHGSSVLGPHLGRSDSSLWVIFSTNSIILSYLLDGPLWVRPHFIFLCPLKGDISPRKGTIMNVLQHSVQEDLGKQNICVCMILPTRRGVTKSESPLFDLLLAFSEYTGWYFDRSDCGRSHGLTIPLLGPFFIAWSDNQLPFIKWALPFWWPGKCFMAPCVGLWTAPKSDRISEACFKSSLFEMRSPFSFQISLWACTTENAQRESVYVFTCLPSVSSRALVRGITSAFWAELPGTGLLPQQSF